MPELPEVETTVRGLARVLLGAEIVRVELRRDKLRTMIPLDLVARLTGSTVTAITRRAKYGLIATARGDKLIFHLGMSGRWRINPTSLGSHDHFILHTSADDALSLHDPRRFGSLDIVRTDALNSYYPLAQLGPEPLGENFTPHYLSSQLACRAASIKALLLNQKIVSGLGNIYVCEALHHAQINPARQGRTLTDDDCERIILAVRVVLEAAIAAGGSTLRDYAAPTGELGYFSKQWQVYGRGGEACSCGAVILRYREGGRSTFYCPACQH